MRRGVEGHGFEKQLWNGSGQPGRHACNRLEDGVNRFDYVSYDAEAQGIQASFKAKFQELETMVEEAFPKPARSKALFLTALEEAYMWVGKQVRDDQFERNAGAQLQEERTNI